MLVASTNSSGPIATTSSVVSQLAVQPRPAIRRAAKPRPTTKDILAITNSLFVFARSMIRRCLNFGDRGRLHWRVVHKKLHPYTLPGRSLQLRFARSHPRVERLEKPCSVNDKPFPDGATALIRYWEIRLNSALDKSNRGFFQEVASQRCR